MTSLMSVTKSAYSVVCAFYDFAHDCSLNNFKREPHRSEKEQTKSKAGNEFIARRIDYIGDALEHIINFIQSCDLPGVIGSALELAGHVAVYCDRMKYQVSSATCISVWQHVQLSDQIRP